MSTDGALLLFYQCVSEVCCALSWRGQEFTVWAVNEMNLAPGRAALRKKQSFILLLSPWGTELMYRDHSEISVRPRQTCWAPRAEAGTSHNVGYPVSTGLFLYECDHCIENPQRLP